MQGRSRSCLRGGERERRGTRSGRGELGVHFKDSRRQRKVDGGVALGIEGKALPGQSGSPSLDRQARRSQEAVGDSDGQRSCGTGSGVSGVNADLGG
jgi:hypothetical protein